MLRCGTFSQRSASYLSYLTSSMYVAQCVGYAMLGGS